MTQIEMNKRLKFLDLKDDINYTFTNILVYEKTKKWMKEKDFENHKKNLKKMLKQIHKYEGIDNNIDIEISVIYDMMKDYR